jgi:hypothetical protein
MREEVTDCGAIHGCDERFWTIYHGLEEFTSNKVNVFHGQSGRESILEGSKGVCGSRSFIQKVGRKVHSYDEHTHSVRIPTRCVVLAPSSLHNNLDIFVCNSPAEGNIPFLPSAPNCAGQTLLRVLLKAFPR